MSNPSARTPNNVIRQTIIARAHIMLERLEESNHISHDATRGSLREAYLRDFLVQSLAHRFKLTSGFVTDALGTTVTPQIDLIISDDSIAPAIQLGVGTAIVPFESVRCICEVKSTLETKHESQICKQYDSLKSLLVTGIRNQQTAHAQFDGIPIFLFAYDNKVARTTLHKWFESIPKLAAICVPKQFLLFRTSPAGPVQELPPSDEHDELLTFLSFVFDLAMSVQITLTSMGFTHSLKPYLQANKLQFPSDLK